MRESLDKIFEFVLSYALDMLKSSAYDMPWNFY